MATGGIFSAGKLLQQRFSGFQVILTDLPRLTFCNICVTIFLFFFNYLLYLSHLFNWLI